MPGDAWKWAVPRVVSKPNRDGTFTQEFWFQKIPEGFPIHVGIAEVQYTWHWVPDPPSRRIDAVLGKVNADAFDGYEARTLLCLPPNVTSLKWTPAGTPVRDITFNLAFRKETWNKFFRASSSQFEDIIDHWFGKPPYETIDFNRLFTI